MFGSSYHMDGVTAFHVPSLSFIPRYIWEIVLFIRMYNIRIMSLLPVVRILGIRSYGDPHMVRLSHPTDVVIDFHLSSTSLVFPGSVLCLDRLIIWMV